MFPAIAIGVVAIGALVLGSGCAGGEDIEMPERRDRDGGDEDVDGASSDAPAESGKDAGPDAPKDAGKDVAQDVAQDVEAGVDAPGDTSTDVTPDSPSDAPADTFVEADSSLPAKYSCKVVVQDSYFGYAMKMVSSEDVATSSSGFTARMRFSGEPPAKAAERINEPAGTWPKGAQDVTLINLTANYELKLTSSGSSYSLAIRSSDQPYQGDAAPPSYTDDTIFPMTFAQSPNFDVLPIEADTSNELYVEFSPYLIIGGVTCTSNCDTLEGTMDINALTDGKYESISIYCNK